MAAASFKGSLGYWDSNQLCELSPYWHPPSPEWIKLNVDASLSCNYNGGIGGVFREYCGRFLGAFGIKCTHWDSSQVELLMIFSAKRFIQDWMYDFKGITIEGDNKNIMDLVQEIFNKKFVFKGHSQMQDFSFLDGFNQVLFHFVNRKSNKLADFCANYARSFDLFWDVLGFNEVPPLFVSLLKEDSLRSSFT
ncbi:hypothetical protein IEQ34_012276 [Dendrobium chrysotoxum]|uniref:RNase H type-1 domain-containing protein n=1 Tax=Dendrobium chrysotoxum TaxID=161865 RepID=A0AAV7GST7_DENCH|nr:hypothetical protein IEQ34_012276 [Dendrobium chrysotoxum]